MLDRIDILKKFHTHVYHKIENMFTIEKTRREDISNRLDDQLFVYTHMPRILAKIGGTTLSTH